jgi:hypothetical protein
MSLSNAGMYGRRARAARDVAEVGDNAKRAIDELIKEIKRLQAQVADLEARVR